MTYSIEYGERFNPKSLSRLPKDVLREIMERIDQKLSSQPDLFGKPLRHSLKGYWSLRVGEYRVIYRIQKQRVLIFGIEHRSVAYKEAKRLLG